MNKKRVRVLKKIDGHKYDGQVVYWMSRDMRFQDNWALIYTLELASKHNVPASIVFALREDMGVHLGSRRMVDFILKSLDEVEDEARKLGVGFHFLIGEPAKALLKYISENKTSAIVTDFSPLAVNRRWKNELVNKIEIPVFEVDAHNIIPCWELTDKQEFAAYTIRSKVHRALIEYLDEFPVLTEPKHKTTSPKTPWGRVSGKIKAIESIKSTPFKPGTKEARIVLGQFIESKLEEYAQERNNPAADGVSNLSPYIHFGNISVQRVALEVSRAKCSDTSKHVFLEELIVRRELAENYCYYNKNYNNFEGFPDWAKRTLNDHASDLREHTYSLEELERGVTHDPAWNAAQIEMVKTGKMHGYMRMYWAKKILEWTSSPQEAQRIAIYLNDLYELDGRDPNGYTGIAWSIGGVHDRPWFERPIFGKIRYMNLNGLKRKFNVDKYINKVNAVT